MSAATECRQMVEDGKADSLLQAMSDMLRAVGFRAMADDVLSERDYSRLQQYARVILKHAAEGKSKPEIRARFALLGLA